MFQPQSNRVEGRVFTGDAEKKEERATSAVQSAAERILDPLYNRLKAASESAVADFASRGIAMLQMDNGDTFRPGWDDMISLAVFPDYAQIAAAAVRSPVIADSNSAQQANHAVSNALDPFATTHNSVPFERIICPPIPPIGE